MSGGHFDYAQHHIHEIACEIERIININDSKAQNEYGDAKSYGLSKETIDVFKQSVYALKQAYICAQRIDWLLSGDDGEEQFHNRLKQDLDELFVEMEKQDE